MRKIQQLFLVLFIAAVSSATYAQTDAKAKAILSAVSKKYRSYDVVKANFKFTIDSKQSNVNQSQQGTLYVRAKANKYRIKMDGQELISDGASQWTYLKENQEVQVSEVDHTSGAMNPAKMFTIYEKGFKYAYNGEKKSGAKTYQVIDLVPIDTKQSYFKIRLDIDKLQKRIANVLIFDKNGNKYNYSITSFEPNVKVPESTFTFNAKNYPGVEVVDLR